MVSTFNILEGEELISFSKAARRFPGCRGAKNINPTTVWRWATHGSHAVDGRLVKLRVIKAGARWFTTDSSIKEFCDSLSRDELSGEFETPRSPAQTRRSSDAAERELIAAGA